MFLSLATCKLFKLLIVLGQKAAFSWLSWEQFPAKQQCLSQWKVKAKAKNDSDISNEIVLLPQWNPNGILQSTNWHRQFSSKKWGLWLWTEIIHKPQNFICMTHLLVNQQLATCSNCKMSKSWQIPSSCRKWKESHMMACQKSSRQPHLCSKWQIVGQHVVCQIQNQPLSSAFAHD